MKALLCVIRSIRTELLETLFWVLWSQEKPSKGAKEDLEMLTNVKIKAAVTERDLSFPLHTETREEVFSLAYGVMEMNFTEEEKRCFSVTLERIS
jgi:hypothetical protein